ncbi:MAG TPA: polysaccharide pyruvyl transferase family protein [Steroidobacteraceae bacterium]|nr:polysaccharide pyruvyl transferase family protein [Steroidobacteraceae bacterium]
MSSQQDRQRATPVRLAFWGNFGTLNLGNECTLAAALHNARRLLPNAELLSVCSNPADTRQRHGIDAIAIAAGGADFDSGQRSGLAHLWARARAILADWPRVLRSVSRFDALLITGTGIVTDIGEGPFGMPFQLFKWAVATRLRGRQLLFVSVGAEAIHHPLSRFFLKTALRLARYRGYRDEHSVAVVRAAGLALQGDVVCPDLAFSLPQPLIAAAAPPPERVSGGRPPVAVGLFNYRRSGRGGPVSAEYSAYVDTVCALILWLHGRGHPVRVIIGDLAYDEPVRLDVRARLEQRGFNLSGGNFVDEPAGSFEQLLLQLRTVELVIASRFHNVLLSLFLGIPVVSVSYESKNDDLMRQMGLGGYCQSLDGLNAERLREQFLDLESRAAEVRAQLEVRSRANRSRLEHQYRRMLEVVGVPGPQAAP